MCRSALGRLFEGGEGRGQHPFGIARPLVVLCLGVGAPPRRELFDIPDFRHLRAGPARLQTIRPAHIALLYAPFLCDTTHCSINRFRRASRVARPAQGGENRTAGRASHHEELCSDWVVSTHVWT